MRIYTIGYSGSSHEDLRRYIIATGAMLVDIRMSPNSKYAQWRYEALLDGIGPESYLHLPVLGNVNFKGGPIRLKDPEAGAHAIANIHYQWGRDVILMCGCYDVLRCHRKVAAEYMIEALPALRPQIVHLPSAFNREMVKFIA